MRLVVALFVVLATKAPAQERRWVVVAASRDTVTYLDSASVKRRDAETVEIWSKRVFATPRHYREDSYDNEMIRSLVDCSNFRLRTLESTLYHGTTLVRRFPGSGARWTWSGRSPGAAWEALIQAACRIEGIPVPNRTPRIP